MEKYLVIFRSISAISEIFSHPPRSPVLLHNYPDTKALLPAFRLPSGECTDSVLSHQRNSRQSNHCLPQFPADQTPPAAFHGNPAHNRLIISFLKLKSNFCILFFRKFSCVISGNRLLIALRYLLFFPVSFANSSFSHKIFPL